MGGYHTILTASACQTAGSYLGFMWTQELNVVARRSDRPNGCYSAYKDPGVYGDAFELVYFNPCESVPTHLPPGFAPICKQDKQNDEVKLKIFTRVRVVKDVTGKSCNRWAWEGEKPFQLFQED